MLCGFLLAKEQMKWKCFFHLWLGVGVQLYRGSSGHVVFQSAVVFNATCHFLTCPTHPPFVCFFFFLVLGLISAVVLVDTVS